MLSKAEIIGKLKEHKADDILDGIRIGLAGSYAKGDETEESDIDIVFDGDSRRIEAAIYVKELFPLEEDVLWLNLLRQEDVELDSLLLGADWKPMSTVFTKQ